MTHNLRVWYDAEGDFLEVTFERKPGYMRETDNDRVMARVDMEGRTIGFSILGISKLKGSPLDVSLSR